MRIRPDLVRFEQFDVPWLEQRVDRHVLIRWLVES